MKLNYETCIVGGKCVLVPYRPQHVERYHSWMQREDLLEATGSERMTLEEEMENQQSWRDDETKCTFIILARDLLWHNNLSAESPANTTENNNNNNNDDKNDKGNDDKDQSGIGPRQSFMLSVEDNIHAMVGDVNLFLSDEDNDEEIDPFAPPPEQQPQQENHVRRLQAEVDIMIANPEYRGKGLGKEAALLMMLYGASKIEWKHNGRVVRYFCKINDTNVASRTLFETKLGFRVKEYIKVFRQYELELKKETNHELIEHLQHMLLGSESSIFPCPLID